MEIANIKETFEEITGQELHMMGYETQDPLKVREYLKLCVTTVFEDKIEQLRQNENMFYALINEATQAEVA